MRIGRDQCRRLLADDPAHAAALQNLALTAFEEGDGIRAIRLFHRAARLHGDQAAFARQVDATLHAALNQISTLLDPGHFDEAGRQLEWLTGFRPAGGHLARLLGTVRLIQGRDDEAARMLAAMDPGDSGLGQAIAGIAAHRRAQDVIGTVVIPAFRAADTIGRALDSIVAAIGFLRRATARADAAVQIVVVDDCSPDGTVDAVRAWAAAHPDQGLTLVTGNRNQGAGRSRNIGVGLARGPYLWFLDADDYFLEPHLHLTAQVLDRCPDMDYVRTDMVFDRIDDQVTPVWRAASRATYPCNLCLRLPCHDRIGGFPEEAPFHPATADDVAYSRALVQECRGGQIAEKTVFYSMRPGNVLARLQEDMISGRAPGEGALVDARFMAIEILIRRKLRALADRRAPSVAKPGAKPGADPRADRLAALLADARTMTAAGRPAQAEMLLRQAVALDPDRRDPWFELGVVSHRLGRRAAAMEAFTRALAIDPDLTPARVNLGLLRLEDGAATDAIHHLLHAVARQPGNANAQFLLARAWRKVGAAAPAAESLDAALRLAPDRAEYHAEAAGLRLDAGNLAGAMQSAERAVALASGLYEAHAAHAAVLERAGRTHDAVAAWNRAIACNAGFGEAFTRRALLLLADRWGPTPTPRPPDATARRLAVTTLGTNGRFGNQLLQYGVTRLYAEHHGLQLETPMWLGRRLYDLDDPLPGPPLPRMAEVDMKLPEGFTSIVAEAANHDIDGYFCGDTSALAPSAARFRRFFSPGRHLRPLADQVRDRLRSDGHTVVAIHLRRGDFGWGPFWTAPEEWYATWLADIWPRLSKPRLYVATDDPGCVPAFAAYRPLTADDLAESVPGIEFFRDFHALCVADVIAISNSSFSFVASMLNDGATAFRPDRQSRALVPFDPWSSPVLIGTDPSSA
ncbi:MAG: hypothetical protein RLY86_1021 [Pseudomonadota bacterium]|jgi:tetratricopeptide (TPR) repeat protein